MGYASYLEDDNDKVIERLRDLSSHLESYNLVSAKEEIRKIKFEIDELLIFIGINKEPLKLAAEIDKLQATIIALHDEIDSSKRITEEKFQNKTAKETEKIRNNAAVEIQSHLHQLDNLRIELKTKQTTLDKAIKTAKKKQSDLFLELFSERQSKLKTESKNTQLEIKVKGLEKEVSRLHKWDKERDKLNEIIKTKNQRIQQLET